ncbi:MAG TPA: hypothetical protein VLA35_11980 [Thermoleophilia bacterium]|nr:hypothetical protein [Thermoleophilia bacterium]
MRGARAAAATAGLVLLALLGAVVVRQVALAADETLEWSVPLWDDLTNAGTTWTAVAAAAFAALGATLLVAAIRVALPPSPPVVEFGEGGASTRVDVATLQSMLARQLGHAAPGLRVERVWLERRPDGWRVWVRAEVPRVELEAVRRRAAAVAADELRRAGGLPLARLDLEVRRVIVRSGG